ncbi:MAG: hypothetical protein AAFR71_11005 [Pseudomonadota bacterium]
MKFLRSVTVLTALAFTSVAFAQVAEMAKENHQQADANGDGLLSYDEFVTFIKLNAEDGLGNAARVEARNMFETAFARVDANGDGSISTAEIQAMR